MVFRENSEIVELISSCRLGDDDAFASIVTEYMPLIKSVISKSGLDFDDVFSDACMSLYRAVLSYDISQDKVTFGLYAEICLSRRMFDIVRSRAKEIEVDFDMDVDDIPAPVDIATALERREERERFRKDARVLLSEYEYEVLLMWLSGDRSSDIASRLGSTAKSVDNAKSRILKKLRRGLNNPE